MRTKLMDRQMPVYSKGEEIFNMVSHIVGAAIGAAGMVLCIIRAASHGNAAGVVGSCIFGATMILLYCMSSIYHGMRDGKGKRVMQVMDHCTIFPLIAGTYTPLLLSAMRPIDPVASWWLFGIVWGITALGITLTAIDLRQFRVFSMVCYLGMGWCVILKLPLMIEAVGWGGFWLILLGGVLYTIGAVLYGVGVKKKWMHSVFHVFVVLASVCHILAILLFAV